MISLPIHHFKSKHPKNLEKIRTDHKMEGVWVPWITWQVPNQKYTCEWTVICMKNKLLFEKENEI